MKRLVLVLVGVCLIGVCMAEPHIISEDEWNTTVKDLAEGNDPRQPDKPALIEPTSIQVTWAAVGVTGLFGLALLGWCLRKRRVKR
jgi:hypothetical protein